MLYNLDSKYFYHDKYFESLVRDAIRNARIYAFKVIFNLSRTTGWYIYHQI